MAKKLSLLAAAAATILAFAVPSTAGAASATCGLGLCPVGTVVTMTGTNIELDTEIAGILKCTGLNLKVKITVNSGGIVKAKGESEKPTQSGCTASGGGTIVVETSEVTNLEASETDGPTGAIKRYTISFIAKVKLPSGAICTFTGTNVPGHYKSTESPTNLTSTDGARDITSTGGCGKAQLFGSLKLETFSGSTATPVILH